ncbi:MAG: hypothetical protein NTX99_11710, partial [Candidatus Aminicenantes bacterium]|nr:hypothetical protein [Candidatus Aminicenantes bacterium]
QDVFDIQEVMITTKAGEKQAASIMDQDCPGGGLPEAGRFGYNLPMPSDITGSDHRNIHINQLLKRNY